jgi:hypothetical protein
MFYLQYKKEEPFMSFLLVNKALLVGLTEHEVLTNNNILSFHFLNVLNSIELSWNMEESCWKHDPSSLQLDDEYRGLVKEAHNAMYHDLHGLATHIDLIKLIYDQRNYQTRHKDILYIQELTEKYLFNLRSIYDFLAKVMRLAVDPKKQGQINLNSFNDLITKIENNKVGDKIPEAAQKSILDVKTQFMNVKDFRDKLVHNGKLVFIMLKDGEYWIGNLVNDRGQEISLPLFDYLKSITIEMMNVADDLAIVIYEEYRSRYGDTPLFYTALDGVCIPSFVEFLGLGVNPEVEEQ